MSFRITVLKERHRWLLSYPQRHFVTDLNEGHVFQCENYFPSFKDAVVYAKKYKVDYDEWSNTPFTYVCNNAGKTELHDLDDDDTVLEFILRLNE